MPPPTWNDAPSVAISRCAAQRSQLDSLLEPRYVNGARTYDAVPPTDAVLLIAFSSDTRYCGLDARPKSQTLSVRPSLTSFALNKPMLSVAHADGSGTRGTRRRTWD